MEVNRKDNGLYRIDDISLEEITQLRTLYTLRVAEAEEHRGVELKDLRELATKFNDAVEKAIWTSKIN